MINRDIERDVESERERVMKVEINKEDGGERGNEVKYWEIKGLERGGEWEGESDGDREKQRGGRD